MTATYQPGEVARPTTERLPRTLQAFLDLIEASGLSCEVVFPSGENRRYGDSTPEFRVRVHSYDAFRNGLTELAIARSYVEGKFDIELDMFAALDLRTRLVDRLPWALLARFWVARLLRPSVGENRFAIRAHYDLGDDFYLSFIDRRWRLYSHGLFLHEAESIEEASEHKLERMYAALRLKPRMRLLDIGAGWGGVEEYCGERGVQVTGLTIAPDSHRYVSALIQRRSLPAEVRLEDFLDHRPAEAYDAIVIYGVIEHIPNYRRFVKRVWDALRPGGRLYVDASASREKFAVSAFARKYIWPGTHTFLCLQDLIRELIYHGMHVVEVQNEARDYELTMRQWAQRFDEARDHIVAGWGEHTYRAFRLYLWGGSRAFRQDLMQAYSIVAERRLERGPRPGLIGRCFNEVKSAL